jgi:hypothetical protein
MMPSLPWLVLSGAAGLLSLIFAAGVAVPTKRPTGARGAVMRWGHALTWLALAAMFAALSMGSAGRALAAALGLTASATYIISWPPCCHPESDRACADDPLPAQGGAPRSRHR